ncbi:MAG: hypothetical protein JSR76_08400 [Verrucomicrobia bacterium]|nr:hypothetical protein [Verrucomicrobiota bacterium]
MAMPGKPIPKPAKAPPKLPASSWDGPEPPVYGKGYYGVKGTLPRTPPSSLPSTPATLSPASSRPPSPVPIAAQPNPKVRQINPSKLPSDPRDPRWADIRERTGYGPGYHGLGPKPPVPVPARLPTPLPRAPSPPPQAPPQPKGGWRSWVPLPGYWGG